MPTDVECRVTMLRQDTPYFKRVFDVEEGVLLVIIEVELWIAVQHSIT